MIDLGINLFQEIAALGGGGGYPITNSLRFNDNDSAYLSRTPATTSNRKTWTWSGWVKRGNLGGQYLFTAGTSSSLTTYCYFDNSTNNLVLSHTSDGANYAGAFTNMVFRDVGAWYHVAISVDTTQSIATNRIKFYVNGELQSQNSSGYGLGTFPQNLDTQISNATLHRIASASWTVSATLDGYLAEVNFIDGQALTPDSFGEIDETTGEWSPKKYSGTYGTNGFYLPFKGNANDDSGNGNNWTENNLASTDYMIDTPTNNFSVLNPLDPLTTGTLSNGNLVTSGNAKVSLRPESGQWYYEKDGVGISYDADTSGQFNPTLSAGSYNFGQYAWADTGPTGTEKTLCTDNLPAPTIEQPETQFNVVTYTGDGTSSNAITGVGFQPDFVWIKRRDAAQSHILSNSVNGAGVALVSNVTSAEFSIPSEFLSFDSDGFTVGYSTAITNNSGSPYVAWCWKAGGTAVSNTDGTITSQVSANVDAGFSIATFTAPATSSTAFTIGHGLADAPEMIITKERDGTLGWLVYHDKLPTPKDNYLLLNTTAANSGTVADCWGTALPTLSVFGMKTTVSVNTSKSVVAYCFHSVEGFSKFGSYVGNGSANGPFVYTGFRPAFVMIKRTDSTSDWVITDNKRDPENDVDKRLFPNLSLAESSAANLFDYTANGFKIRSADGFCNASGGTYIYMAFAEAPFKNSTGR